MANSLNTLRIARFTAPLSDGTAGFRFRFAIKYNNKNLFTFAGLTRKRKPNNIRFGISLFSGCMSKFHMGRRSVYIERKANRQTKRKLCHFAG
jgi:hypothetical protein|tara:strand:+ start:493 stop:771 length:279 start_codon:yes stop_codon:yes gene_type:complete